MFNWLFLTLGNIILLLCNLTIQHSHKHCGFKHNNDKELLKWEFNETRTENLRIAQQQVQQVYQPLRIYYDYTTLDNQQSVSVEMKNNIKQVLSEAKLIFESILKVRRYPYLLNVKNCETADVSQQVQSPGIDADLIIFPFLDLNQTEGITEAFASACVISTKDNRPVAGMIGFTLNMNTTRTNWLQYYTNLAIHELTHVLVFNPTLFKLFIDKNTGNLIPTNKIFENVTINNMPRTRIITPKVVAAARKHFNCDSLTGVDLEDQGGVGTAGAHWDSRIMLGDYMIGMSYDENVFSDITLALFEDSGWYEVNYYTGGLFRFGKGEGCGFLEEKCVISSNRTGVMTKYPYEYCTEQYQPMCTTGRSSKGFCYISDSNFDINENYRYFGNAHTGGLMWADYCPIAAVPTNENYFFPWNCQTGLNSEYPAELEETFGRMSGCFVSSLVNRLYTSLLKENYYYSDRSICYNYICNFNNSTVSVKVGNKVINCPQEGGTVSNIMGYLGSLTCPDFNQICTSTVRCTDLKDCVVNGVTSLDSTYIYNYMRNNTDEQTIIENIKEDSGCWYIGIRYVFFFYLAMLV
jgi:leishmanolysin-like peptidase